MGAKTKLHCGIMINSFFVKILSRFLVHVLKMCLFLVTVFWPSEFVISKVFSRECFTFCDLVVLKLQFVTFSP